MLLKSEIKYKFPDTYQKVLDHCLAYDNTLVFTGIKTHRNYCLTHLDENGKLLGEQIFRDDGVDSMQLVTEKELIGLLPESSEIAHWDLETHEFTKIPFPFEITDTFCSRLFIFQETKEACIMEHGPLGETFFRLTYIKLPIVPGK